MRHGRAIALDWLVGHLDYAHPFLGQSQAELLFRRKCFNELALLLLLQEQFPEAPPQLAAIRAFVGGALNDDYLSLSARRPETLLMFCHALAYGSGSDAWSAAQLERVRGIVSGNFAWGIDGSVFRFLELLVACRYAGVPGRMAAAEVMSMSPLAHPPSPIHGSRNAYYALTHAEFFRFLLKQALPANAPQLALSLKGGMARTLADRDADLGLELVTASLLQQRPLEPEALMLLEAALDDLTGPGVITPPAAGAAIHDFTAAVPDQAAWARHFHVMLVAAICLTVACAMAAGPLHADAGERGFATRIGQGLLDFHKYRLASGVRQISGLQGRSAGQAALLDEAADFLRFSRNSDGQFGCFIDELAQGGRVLPEQAAPALQAINLACQAYLQSTSQPRMP